MNEPSNVSDSDVADGAAQRRADVDPIATSGDNGETLPNPSDDGAVDEAIERVDDLDHSPHNAP